MPDVLIFAQFATHAPQLLGRRTLSDKRTAIRETAELLRQISEAMGNEATFLEITDELRSGE